MSVELTSGIILGSESIWLQQVYETGWEAIVFGWNGCRQLSTKGTELGAQERGRDMVYSEAGDTAREWRMWGSEKAPDEGSER